MPSIDQQIGVVPPEGVRRYKERFGGQPSRRGLDLGPLQSVALLTSPIPGIGDIVGASADAKAVYNNPSLFNIGMAGVGLLPFVPGGMAGTLRKSVSSPPRKLREEEVDAFQGIASSQRGAPEKAMLDIQRTAGGGVLSPVVEHVGDLTHRMTERARYGQTGRGYIESKVDKTLGILKSRYGFEKEMKENLRNNAQFKGVSEAELTRKVDDLLQQYAKEHRKLKTYNMPQYLAREAAVAIGDKNFLKAERMLQNLKRLTDNPETYESLSRQAKRDNKGNLSAFTDEDFEEMKDLIPLSEQERRIKNLKEELGIK